MSYARGFRAGKREADDSLPASPVKKTKIKQEEEDTIGPFYSPRDLKQMCWSDKKGLVNKNWNVEVLLCKGDSSKSLLNERIHFLKDRLMAIPWKGGFIYAGDVVFYKAKGVGIYKCSIAFAMDANVSYGAIVSALGAFDCPKTEESYYCVTPCMGFPYWGLIGAKFDRHEIGVVYSAGPLYTRGEPRNCFMPVRYFLNGIEPHGIELSK